MGIFGLSLAIVSLVLCIFLYKESTNSRGGNPLRNLLNNEVFWGVLIVVNVVTILSAIALP